MFDHIGTYTVNFPATRKFYEEALGTLGYSVQMEFVAEWNNEFPTQRMCAFGPAGKPAFWIIEVKETYTPRHVAFTATTRDQVRAFYQAAINSGGRDNGAPGLRSHYHEHYFGAFVLDPDGNNMEAVCHSPE